MTPSTDTRQIVDELRDDDLQARARKIAKKRATAEGLTAARAASKAEQLDYARQRDGRYRQELKDVFGKLADQIDTSKAYYLETVPAGVVALADPGGGTAGLQRLRGIYGGLQSVGSAMGYALPKRVSAPLVAVDPTPEGMRELRAGKTEPVKRRPGIILGRR